MLLKKNGVFYFNVHKIEDPVAFARSDNAACIFLKI